LRVRKEKELDRSTNRPKYTSSPPEQAALVEKAIAREKVLIKNIQQRTPLVETYIQNTRPDVKLYEVPVGRPVHAEPRRLRQGLLRQGL
jgi:hypothetical protein